MEAIYIVPDSLSNDLMQTFCLQATVSDTEVKLFGMYPIPKLSMLTQVIRVIHYVHVILIAVHLGYDI